MSKRPNSMRHLDDAIRRASGGTADGYVRMRTLVANAIVAQMLPDGVVKGGSAVRMRFGSGATRYTTDLDTATASDPDEYAARLSDALAAGWEGFTGRVVRREPAAPPGIPGEYVMRPYDVKLSYLGRPWCTVPLEVGFDEIGDAERADVTCQGAPRAPSRGSGSPPSGTWPSWTSATRWPRSYTGSRAAATACATSLTSNSSWATQTWTWRARGGSA